MRCHRPRTFVLVAAPCGGQRSLAGAGKFERREGFEGLLGERDRRFGRPVGEGVFSSLVRKSSMKGVSISGRLDMGSSAFSCLWVWDDLVPFWDCTITSRTF